MTGKRKPKEGRYSAVSRRVWVDERFRSLSAPKPNAQTLWFRLLTGPELGCIPGLFAVRLGGVADALQWPLGSAQRCWAEIEAAQMAHADWKAGLVWVPRAIEHNEPESPNVVRSWRTALVELPECALKGRAMASLRTHLESIGEPWAKAFDEASGKPSGKASAKPPQTPSPNQDQEQEQEREIPLPPSGPPRPRPPDPLAASFLPLRPDVADLHDRWKRTTGLRGHKLRGPTDLDAVTLAEALDLHGMADCLAVLSTAMADRMVTGEADEKRQRHDSIRYIFGNAQTFARLLRAAHDRDRRQAGAGVGALERAMTAKPDLSDYRDPEEPTCPPP